MNSENLGNFLYGCTGKHLGLSLDILLSGSEYAAFIYDSTDNEEDYDYIRSGYDYEEDHY